MSVGSRTPLAVVDGFPIFSEEELEKHLRPDSIVRVGRHLYMNRKALTVGAESWPFSC
jgi:hypothetical protein